MPIGFLESSWINEWNVQPSRVKGIWNQDTMYYKKMLYRIIYGHYDFDLPEQNGNQIKWAKNWFKMLLFDWGSVGVFYTKKFGWLPLPYSILRFDVQYNPLVIQSTSNYMLDKTIRGIVGVNCGIVKIFDDFFGYDSVVTHYAEKLAAFDKGINVNIMNSSLGLYVEVDSPKEAEDVKTAYHKATAGEPLVVSGAQNKSKDILAANQKERFLPMFSQAKNMYLGTEFLEGRRTIINQFLTDIGINNANTDKRERLISNEVEANNEEIITNTDYVLNNIREGFEEINRISGLNLQVRAHNGGDLNGRILRSDTERDV